ncbi:MAG: hypothetical protein GY717_18765 [Rhodobacteraceae bacterium]|nr:hypothetical protein [Paracoccaceae bacterium]
MRGFFGLLHTDTGARTIPTNRWFWIELSPGFFVPEPAAESLAFHRDAASEEWAAEFAEAERQLDYLHENRPTEVADEYLPTLWCVEFVNAAAGPRLACIGADT